MLYKKQFSFSKIELNKIKIRFSLQRKFGEHLKREILWYIRPKIWNPVHVSKKIVT